MNLGMKCNKVKQVLLPESYIPSLTLPSIHTQNPVPVFGTKYHMQDCPLVTFPKTFLEHLCNSHTWSSNS